MKRRFSLPGARRLATHAAAASGFAAMTTGGEIPLPATIAFVVVLIASLAKRDRPLPGLSAALTVATAGAGVVLLFLVAQGPLDLVLGASLFAAAVCSNRLLGRKGPQDDPLLLLTTLLMLAAGAALSGELAYALCFVAYGFSATLALTLSHLERSAEEAHLSPNARDALLGPSLALSVSGLSALALLGAAAVFILFPRVNAQWLGRHRGSRSVVGYTGQVQLGGSGELGTDARPALRVHFPDFDADHLPRDLTDEQGTLDLLWRGAPLDHFDGKSWSVTTGPNLNKPLAGAPVGPFALRVQVEVLPHTESMLIFSPGDPLAARILSLDTPQERRGPMALLDKLGRAFIVPAPDGYYAYELWTKPVDASKLRGHGRTYPEEVRRRNLQLPKDLDPRVAELAKRWAGTATEPLDQAQALVNHLRAEYRYTTQLPGDVSDPLADFLFSRKAGHCEFFSTAMVVMLRTLGVPAREVTGFAGGVRAPAGDHFIVRGGDAHAWVEVYVPDVGFVDFDPSPPAARDTVPHGVQAWLMALSDAASEWWRKEVIDYDLRTQVDALRRAGQAISNAAQRFSRDDDNAPHALPYGKLKPILLVLAIGLAIAIVRRALRRNRPTTPSDEAAAAYAQMLGLLSWRGVRRGEAETARELCARLRRESFAQAADVEQLTALYEQARFAGKPWGAQERANVRALLGSVRR